MKNENKKNWTAITKENLAELKIGMSVTLQTSEVGFIKSSIAYVEHNIDSVENIHTVKVILANGTELNFIEVEKLPDLNRVIH